MKNFKLKLSLIIITVFIMTLSSCSRRVLDFTLISTKNVDLSKAAYFERGNQRVSGEDQIHIIIFIPTGSVNIKEAIDRAIETTPGCIALVDGVITSKFWWIPYVYGQSSATVEGTPLIDKSLAVNSNEIPKFRKIEMNKHGKVKNIEIISSQEYYAMKYKTLKDSREIGFGNSNKLD